MTQESLSPYKMNMPTDLKDRIAIAAKRNNRSLSGEVIRTLEEKYPPAEGVEEVAAAVVEFITSKVPRETFVQDFEDRISEIIAERFQLKNDPAEKRASSANSDIEELAELLSELQPSERQVLLSTAKAQIAARALPPKK